MTRHRICSPYRFRNLFGSGFSKSLTLAVSCRPSFLLQPENHQYTSISAWWRSTVAHHPESITRGNTEQNLDFLQIIRWSSHQKMYRRRYLIDIVGKQHYTTVLSLGCRETRGWVKTLLRVVYVNKRLPFDDGRFGTVFQSRMSGCLDYSAAQPPLQRKWQTTQIYSNIRLTVCAVQTCSGVAVHCLLALNVAPGQSFRGTMVMPQ